MRKQKKCVVPTNHLRSHNFMQRPHILWSREWAYGQRSASKDGYVLYSRYLFGIVNTDFGEDPFHAIGWISLRERCARGRRVACLEVLVTRDACNEGEDDW
jgi:hypothetical protein